MTRWRTTFPAWIAAMAFFMDAGANTPPFVSNPIPDTTMPQGSTLSIDLTRHFSQITIGQLGYFIGTSTSKISGKADVHQKLTLRAEKEWTGTARVWVTAINAEQETACDTFRVEVLRSSRIESIRKSNRTSLHEPLLRCTAGRLVLHPTGTGPGLFHMVDAAGRSLARIHVKASGTVHHIPGMGKGVFHGIFVTRSGKRYTRSFVNLD